MTTQITDLTKGLPDWHDTINSNFQTVANGVDETSNKIGDLTGNGLTETDLATAIKNDRSQLSEIVLEQATQNTNIGLKANQTALNATNADVASKANYADLVVERERIDNLVATESTTDNMETADIRVGTDGVTYSSAGTAVRSQLNAIKNGSKISYTKENVASGIITNTYFGNDLHAIVGDVVNITVTNNGTSQLDFRIQLNGEGTYLTPLINAGKTFSIDYTIVSGDTFIRTYPVVDNSSYSVVIINKSTLNERINEIETLTIDYNSNIKNKQYNGYEIFKKGYMWGNGYPVFGYQYATTDKRSAKGLSKVEFSTNISSFQKNIVVWKTDGNIVTQVGTNSTSLQIYTFDGSEEFYAINTFSDSYSANATSNAYVIEYLGNGSLVDAYSSNKNEKLISISDYLKNQITSGYVVSPITSLSNISCGIKEWNNGWFYISSRANDEEYGDYDNMCPYAMLTGFNMANPNKTSFNIKLIEKGDILPDGTYVYNSTDPVLEIKDNTIYVIARVISVPSVDKLNVDLSTIDDDVIKFVTASIPINSDGTLNNTQIAFSITKLGDIPISSINATALISTYGITTYTGDDATKPGAYLMNCNLSFDGTNYYGGLALHNGSHCLIKTIDFVNWDFVADIPSLMGSDETATCYYDGKIYCAVRGWSVSRAKSTHIISYDIVGETWGSITYLKECSGERPSLIEFDGYIYVIAGQGGSKKVDNQSPPRNTKFIYKLSTGLTILSTQFMYTEIPFVYPILFKTGVAQYVVGNCDFRQFWLNHGGDGRADIIVSPFNISLI